jgi:hypothetical protein
VERIAAPPTLKFSVTLVSDSITRPSVSIFRQAALKESEISIAAAGLSADGFRRHCHRFGNVPQTFIFAVRYLIKASRIFREAFRRALADKSDADGIAFVAGAVGNRQTAANQTPDLYCGSKKS